MTNIVVPDMGEGVEKATVSYWFAKVGDSVENNTDLVELATDKATFNVAAPADGELKQIMAQEGQSVKPGDVLGVIE